MFIYTYMYIYACIYINIYISISDQTTYFVANFVASCLFVAAFFLQVPKLCTNLEPTIIYILILGTYGRFARENKCQSSAFASRRHARALATDLLRQDQVHITTDELVRFHNNEFDEMPCELDSTENPCSFEKYPTLS